MSILPATPVLSSTYGVCPFSFEDACRYGRALLVIAGADGEVPHAEMDWLIQHTASLGFPQAVLEQLHSFDYLQSGLDEQLEGLAEDRARGFRRMLLYDAIRMARADRVYSDKERAAVRQAAQLLQVPADVAIAIEGLVDLEDAARKIRQSLFT